jgi:hypothetical protein
MTHDRASWIETFSSFVQFYPRLTTAIALTTMAAAGRMVSGSQSTVEALDRDSVPHLAPTTPAKRPAKAAKRKTTKRTAARR